jgi:hypothetical protein
MRSNPAPASPGSRIRKLRLLKPPELLFADSKRGCIHGKVSVDYVVGWHTLAKEKPSNAQETLSFAYIWTIARGARIERVPQFLAGKTG